MADTLLEPFVEQLLTVRFEQLPPEVIAKAKLCVLDTLGVALAGALTPTCKAAREFALSMGGRQETTLYRFGDRISCVPAAYANGVMAFCYNFTDTTLSCIVHCGPVIVPTALALAEKNGNTGRDVLLAVILGYEMMTRVGNAINSGVARMSHHKRGFHGTGTTGVFGAAMTASKLMAMQADKTLDALGIAGSYAAGLLESSTVPRADVWKTHAGIASQNGISAAMLAEYGLKGPASVLEGKRAFFSAYAGADVDLGILGQEVGKRFLIMDSAFKLHNCAHVWANPLDSLRRILSSHPVEPADVAAIQIRIPTMYTYVMDSARGSNYPRNYGEAESNPPYLMAAMMLHGRVFVQEFHESVMQDPKMREIAGKVSVVVDPSLDKVFQETDKSPAEVRVILKASGQGIVERADYPRGCPQNPATPAEIESKFIDLAKGVLGEERAREIVREVSELDQASHVKRLVALLVA